MPVLSHLIGLGVAAVTLQVEAFRSTRLPEDVMAPSYTFYKTQAEKQSAKILESDAGIRLTLAYPILEFRVSIHVPAWPRTGRRSDCFGDSQGSIGQTVRANARRESPDIVGEFA